MRRSVVLLLTGLMCSPGPLPALAGAPATAPAAARPGVNLLAGAKWVYSVDRGKNWTDEPPVARGGQVIRVAARTAFEVSEPAGFDVLELTPGFAPRQAQAYLINGERVPLPLNGMYYKTIRAIPASLLKAGRNLLAAGLVIDNRPPPKERAEDMPDISAALATDLRALTHADLAFTTGPVLGAAGPGWFSVTCRTNMPARVKLTARALDADGKPVGKPVVKTSAGPLSHRFRVGGLGAETATAAYTLAAAAGDATITKRCPAVRLPGRTDRLRFVAMGDSRSHRDDWAAVAAAAVKARPDLVVFSGDMVSRGRDNWLWEEHFFSACPALFARIPFYAICGNHEERAPVFPLLFYTPSLAGLSSSWAQRVGPVLLIGIDSLDDFSAKSPNVRWLSGELARAKAKFIFLFAHHPAWSSGKHTRPKDGQPREAPVRRMRDVVVPLLTRHKATAMIVGHDHLYERSELPGGLTHVVSGGAGAPLRGKVAGADEQNPHSKAFASKLHFCLIEAAGDTCTLRALTPGGEEIDRRTWSARPSP